MPIASTPRVVPLATFLTLAVLAIPALAAQQTPDSATTHRTHAIPVPMANAVLREGTVVIDGKLDDAAWAKATPITSFTQREPDEGKPASERTEVRFLYDDGALYVAGRMFDSRGAAGVTSRLIRRDANSESDWFNINIDAYHDHLGEAMFELNPAGVKWDAAGASGNTDVSWDPVWEGAATIDSLGWTAEMRIPYSQLRFSQAEMQTWGLQVTRFIQRRNELSRWSFWGRTEVGGPSRFGHLEGLRIASMPRHVEVLPYVVARSRHIRPTLPNDPFNDGNRQDMRVGADLKTLLTSNITLDATLNPDFGQVEVDPASVNLSAFETFFSEKRPFFVAGSGIFGFGSASCYFCSNFNSVESFYSRRIGRSPQGADLADVTDGYSDIPESATILGAAKITGRTAGGISLGILDAVTRREMANVVTPDSAFRVEVEPLTNYFVGRATKDYRGGNLVIGGIATSVVRRLNEGVLQQRLNSHAEAIGADLVAQWSEKTYSLFATVELSNIAGDSTAILRAQRSSARYYQRPDRRFGRSDFLSGFYDSSATSLRGLASYLRLAKDGGSLNWEAQLNSRTPGFEVNDISFISRADYIQEIANVSYNWTKPTSWYRNLSVIVGGQRGHNFDGDVNYRDAHLWFGGQTPNFWNVNAWVMHMPQVYDERTLRGGPVATSPSTSIVSLFLNTDQRARVVVSSNPQFQQNSEGGFQSRLNMNARWKPVSNISASFGPSYSLSRGVQQYVTSVADPTSTLFYGRRYVLSSLVQKTLSLDTRFTMTFSPTSSLELYAQPFIASGAYSAFKEFDRPRYYQKSVYGVDKGTIASTRNTKGEIVSYTIDPDAAGPAAPFTVDNPDFNIRSLRGNAVYRWEYRPGSTLFFVWTQSREHLAAYDGSFEFDRDRSALFSAHPDNIFLVKLNYWLGR
jgi:hypothetical protein